MQLCRKRPLLSGGGDNLLSRLLLLGDRRLARAPIAPQRRERDGRFAQHLLIGGGTAQRAHSRLGRARLGGAELPDRRVARVLRLLEERLQLALPRVRRFQGRFAVALRLEELVGGGASGVRLGACGLRLGAQALTRGGSLVAQLCQLLLERIRFLLRFRALLPLPFEQIRQLLHLCAQSLKAILVGVNVDVGPTHEYF